LRLNFKRLAYPVQGLTALLRFKKLPGTRRELFEQLDRPALRPLPAQPYPKFTIRTYNILINQ